jgi:hypothetical protein
MHLLYVCVCLYVYVCATYERVRVEWSEWSSFIEEEEEQEEEREREKKEMERERDEKQTAINLSRCE